MNIEQEYLTCAIANFKSMKQLGEGTIAQLTDEELNWSPNAESNSIAIIIKHMSGNMISRWTNFLTTDGEKPYRNRDDEFEGNALTKEQVVEMWEVGWQVVFQTLGELTEADLLKTIYIRSEPHSVIKAIQRQIAHYSNHIGQIVYIGKQIKNEQWHSLSIPRGKSLEYLREKERQ